MSTPAERFAAARRREDRPGTELATFAATYPFPLDPFQMQACAAVESGSGVLVAAPTGSGKTVVGEFAVHLALARARKAFYTTPIKALSNQKYADLCRRHGAAHVGLLTGDSSINGEAPVVVMTTEVLRNMMYAGSSTLAGLGFVVMDEVHYLADRFRGAVWEEVIIHLPQEVQVISLSATVSNAEEFGAWLGEVRGEMTTIVEEHRPVPLWQHMMVGDQLFDLFVEVDDEDPDEAATVNPDLLAAIQGRHRDTDRRGRREDAGAPRGRRGKARPGRGRYAGHYPEDERGHGSGNGRGSGRGNGGGHGRDRYRPNGSTDPRGNAPRAGQPSRSEVVAQLERDGLLPAIYFIFSRVGCDAAVTQLLTRGTRLISPDEGDRLRRLVEERVAGLATDDLTVLGYWEFLEGITRGFAAHHAGMLPTFREIVEELFTQGRIRAVFATETLALGINMPARTVVLEKLVKFNGETHAEITPAEYTQLTGRAGRRGIDVEGHAVVLWNPQLDPLAVGGLASTRTYPLRSSFRPTYNMAVNLVARFGREHAARVLETSFAQFQADRAVVGLTRTIRRNEEALDGYREAMTCHLGDFSDYAALRAELSAVEKDAVRARSAGRRAEVAASLQRLRLGDVVWLPGRREGPAVVVAPARPGRGEAAVPAVVTDEARLRRLDEDDLSQPLTPFAQLRVPKGFAPRNVAARKDLAATLRATVHGIPPTQRYAARNSTPVHGEEAAPVGGQARAEELRRRMRDHPCHRCPDREHHARWAERWHRLARETESLQRKVDGRTSTVARTFNRICDLLVELGYLALGSGDGDGDGEMVRTTAAGERLRRLYTERDLLAAECLSRGIWTALDVPSLAAVVSCLVHEPRREGPDPSVRMPNADVITAHDRMVDIWSELEDREQRHRLQLTAYPDPGMAWMMHRWAAGQRLDVVLRDSDMAAGDFVRRCKQTVDLLDQIAVTAPQPTLARAARRAVDAVMRGVVAADRLD